MRQALQFAAIVAVSLWSGGAMADDQRFEGCAGYHGADEGDRGASDVYIAGHDADGNGTCYLVPRSVILREARSYYVDSGFTNTVNLEPADLLEYLRGKSQIMVGHLRRDVPKDLEICLDSQLPMGLQIFSGDLGQHNALERTQGHAAELPSEMPGYRRFREEGWRADYYVATDQQREVKSFECGPYFGGRYTCPVNGEYNRTRILVAFWKSEMPKIDPEAALQCARGIAALFRIK